MTIGGRAAKLLVLALTVSLALNFAAIGFGGAVIGGGMVLAGIVRDATSNYPPQLRDAFRAELRAHRGAVRDALKTLREAREAQQAVLIAPKLNRAAAEAAQARVREAGIALVSLLQSMLLDAVATLPDDVRREIPRAPIGIRALRGLGGAFDGE